ncbi:MAG: Grx4 family monothiol glutaredoxin [Deltaproteobacteria bacterium]|nr:Grx4 family monothiol glutaredoxin [Deltaproteobacteria bacterium]MBI3295367.1 Grx4 family monothiol glutaredoxin [Deltaproteobacteria bacterium]
MNPQNPIHNQIANDIKKYPVVVFMKGTKEAPLCGFSHTVVEIFKMLGAPIHSVDVLSDPTVRDGIKSYTNWPTIPQVFVKGEFIGGCDITRDLFESGELEKKVKSALSPQNS